MRLPRALAAKKMDLRLRDKMTHEKKISKKELDEFLNSLPDDGPNATTVDAVEEKRLGSAEQQAPQ